MNKFNEQKQIEETTAFQDNEVMHELNNEQQFTSMAHKRRVERLQTETEYGFFLSKRGWGRTTRPTRLPYFTDRVSEENKMDKFDLLILQSLAID